jgi:hypothetical protein
MMYLDVIPALEIVFCSLVVLLFVATSMLNLKDFQTMRQDKWTRLDSAAIMLRGLFYAFVLNFLLIVGIDAGILLFTTVLRSSVSLQQILPLVEVPLEVSFGMLAAIGVIYGMARWKEWYDLIDAEY